MRGGAGHAVGMSDSMVFVDARGRRRSPATLPAYHAGRPPRNKGRRMVPSVGRALATGLDALIDAAADGPDNVVAL